VAFGSGPGTGRPQRTARSCSVTIRGLTAPRGSSHVAAKSPPGDGQLVARHLRFGWWSLALFGLLGLALETLHGFKVGAYLDVSNDTRRLMWTLAHADGTLLGLVHLGFAATVRIAHPDDARLTRASSALVAASVLLPGGFFLGGIRFYAGDPGIGVVLVPIGATLTIVAAVTVARLLSGADIR
jgi:hypothetical protein